MKDLAPQVYRQRLLIEAIYEIDVQEETIHRFFDALVAGLRVTAAGDAVVNSSLGMGKPENQGIEAFLPLIESGVAVYTWQSSRFLSIILYTCRAFEQETALDLVREFFQASALEFKAF
ncbi:MAG: S-adenosylmethionine decarboxylase [Halioglobus sp.]|nr:S-adenosylmethionine decarboxylase [Halioglobus sp.]